MKVLQKIHECARRLAGRGAGPPPSAGLRDIVWAATRIPGGPYAPFAARYRRDRLEALPETPGLEVQERCRFARVLARLEEGTDADRLVTLAALEGVLAATAPGRWGDRLEEVVEAVPALTTSESMRYLDLVEVVFDALGEA